MRWIGLCVLVSLVAGCVAPATITMRDGEVIEAVIEGGDAATLEVSTDDGGYRALERGEIEDINHPKTMLGVGGAMIGASILVTSLGLFLTVRCRGSDCGAEVYTALLGGLSFVVGVPVTIAGAGRYLGSRDRAVPSAGGVSWSPLVVPDGAGGVAAGVGVMVSW